MVCHILPLKGGSVLSVEIKYFTVPDVDLKKTVSSVDLVWLLYLSYYTVNFTSKQKYEFHSGHQGTQKCSIWICLFTEFGLSGHILYLRPIFPFSNLSATRGHTGLRLCYSWMPLDLTITMPVYSTGQSMIVLIFFTLLNQVDVSRQW